jgi:DNA polymerase elongation subunit (family B)
MKMNVFTLRVREDRAVRETVVTLFGRGEDGQPKTVEVHGTKPCFWVSDPKGLRPGLVVEGKRVVGMEKDGTSIDGRSLWKVTVEYPSDVARGRTGGKGLRDWYREQGVETFCADIRFTEKFRLDARLRSGCEVPEGNRVELSDVHPMTVDAPAVVGYMDIEVDEGVKGGWLPAVAANPVLSISWYLPRDNRMVCVVQGDHLPADLWVAAEAICRETSRLWKDTGPKVDLVVVPDERSLFETVSDLLTDPAGRPDVLTGWNYCDGDSNLHVVPFDVPYLKTRAQRMGYDASRKVIGSWDGQRMFDSVQTFDLLSGYRMVSSSKSDNSLDSVARRELGETKMPLPLGIHGTYVADPARFIAYNMMDCLLAWGIDRKKEGIVNTFLTRVSHVGTSLSEAFRETVLVDMYLLHSKWGSGLVLNNKPITDGLDMGKMEKGGLVWIKGEEEGTPLAAVLSNMVVFDVKSTYPSIIQTWNMSRETLLEGEAPPGVPYCTVPSTGRRYRLDRQGMIATMLTDIVAERDRLRAEAAEWRTRALSLPGGSEEQKEANRRCEALLEQDKAAKFLNNSVIGALATAETRLSSGVIATDVGWTARTCLEDLRSGVVDWEGEWRPEVCYNDTDSMLTQFLHRETGEVAGAEIALAEGRKMVPWLCERMRKFAERQGCRESFLGIKLEQVYESILFVGVAKRYAATVAFCPTTGGFADLRGKPHDYPQRLVIKGFQTKRHDTPEEMRGAQKELMLMVLAGRSYAECAEYVEDFHRRCAYGSEPERWMTPASLSKPFDQYGKRKDGKTSGIPAAVKAAKWSNDHQGTDLGVGDDFLWGYGKGPGLKKGETLAIVPDRGMPEGYDLDWEEQWERRVLPGMEKILSVIRPVPVPSVTLAQWA